MQDNRDQADYWNGPSGQRWVTQEDGVDAIFAPVLDRVLSLAALRTGERVLDVGCGSGASSLAASGLVGPQGSVLGLDISAPLLDRARARAKGSDNVAFRQADAATDDLTAAAFDVLISRFGVMFFAEPVGAFANLRRALRPGARLAFAAWGEIAANPFFTMAAQAANARLGAPPKVDPDAPGPFAFREAPKVSRILSDAGFQDVRARTEQVPLTPPGDLARVAALMIALGPAARAMDHFNGTEADAAALRDNIAHAFAPFETPQGVMIPAEINFFTAEA